MQKLPPIVRAPPFDLREAKRIAERARAEHGELYDMVEIFGASGSLVRGFESFCYECAEPFDCRIWDKIV